MVGHADQPTQPGTRDLPRPQVCREPVCEGCATSVVLSLTYVFVPSSRGSTGVVDFLPKHGVSLYATGRTTSVVLSLAYVCIPAQQGIAWAQSAQTWRAAPPRRSTPSSPSSTPTWRPRPRRLASRPPRWGGVPLPSPRGEGSVLRHEVASPRPPGVGLVWGSGGSGFRGGSLLGGGSLPWGWCPGCGWWSGPRGPPWWCLGVCGGPGGVLGVFPGGSRVVPRAGGSSGRASSPARSVCTPAGTRDKERR